MKNKIYFLTGIQGSGKTTRAKEILSRDGLAVRVNKDDMRLQLFCSHWLPKREKTVVKMERLLVTELLKSGHNVILDNTHLSGGHEEFYSNLAKELGASFEIIKLDTPVFECIRRDKERADRGERSVGRDVILNTAWTSNTWRSPNKCVVSDLDGTLADCNHRRHFVRNLNNDPNWRKDWHGFFSQISLDTLRQEVADQLKSAKAAGLDIILVSARPYTYRKATEAWLLKNGIQWDRLLMREASDNRDDTIVKQEIIDKLLDKTKIITWFDDRKCVIDAVRSNGINVINVGGDDNDF